MELVLYPADEQLRFWGSSKHCLSNKDVTYILMLRNLSLVFWLSVIFAVGRSICLITRLPFKLIYQCNQQMYWLYFQTKSNVWNLFYNSFLPASNTEMFLLRKSRSVFCYLWLFDNHPSVHQSVYNISFHPLIHPSILPLIYPCICPSIRPFIYPFKITCWILEVIQTSIYIYIHFLYRFLPVYQTEKIGVTKQYYLMHNSVLGH